MQSHRIASVLILDIGCVRSGENAFSGGCVRTQNGIKELIVSSKMPPNCPPLEGIMAVSSVLSVTHKSVRQLPQAMEKKEFVYKCTEFFQGFYFT